MFEYFVPEDKSYMISGDKHLFPGVIFSYNVLHQMQHFICSEN